MNKAILMDRLTRDPEIRYSNGPEQTAVGRFTLAVDRRGQRQGNQQNADFIPCVAFGKKAEFVEKYTHKGTKVIVEEKSEQEATRTGKEERCTPQKSMSVTLSSPRAKRQQSRTRTGTTISTE